MNIDQTVQLLSQRMPEIRRRWCAGAGVFSFRRSHRSPVGSDVDVLVEFAERTATLRSDDTEVNSVDPTEAAQPVSLASGRAARILCEPTPANARWNHKADAPELLT